MDLEITLKESLLGFSKTIDHLDRHKFTVKSSPGEIIQPDSWKIIPGEGMPIRGTPSEFGDMHVKFKVKLPKQLSKSQIKMLGSIFPASG